MRTQKRAVAAATLAAIAAAVALPALGGAQTSGAHDLTVRDKVRAVKFVHHGRSARGEKLAMGDRVITRQAVFNESDHRIGKLFTDCVNVGRKAQVFNATLECTSIYRFSGGQVVSQGIVRLGSSPASVRIAIVGGTGAYRSAAGEVGAGAPVKGYDTVDVLHLDG
jgi:hypothetical protein